jgi:hypothetical protein
MRNLTIVTPHDEAEDRILRLEDELTEAEQDKLAAVAAAAATNSDTALIVEFLVDEITTLRLDANAMASDLRKLRQEVRAMRRREGGVPSPSASKN